MGVVMSVRAGVLFHSLLEHREIPRMACLRPCCYRQRQTMCSVLWTKVILVSTLFAALVLHSCDSKHQILHAFPVRQCTAGKRCRSFHLCSSWCPYAALVTEDMCVFDCLSRQWLGQDSTTPSSPLCWSECVYCMFALMQSCSSDCVCIVVEAFFLK